MLPGISVSLVSPHVFDVTASGACGISLRAAGPWAVAARSKEAWGICTQYEFKDVVVFSVFVIAALSAQGQEDCLWGVCG